jgi:hypothetical protein
VVYFLPFCVVNYFENFVFLYFRDIFLGRIILRAMNIPSLDTEGTKDDNQQSMGFIMKEEAKCHCSNAIPEDKIGVNTNDQIIDLMTYDGKRTNLEFFKNVL